MTVDGVWILDGCSACQLNHQTAVNLQVITVEKVTPSAKFCYNGRADGWIREIDRRFKQERERDASDRERRRWVLKQGQGLSKTALVLHGVRGYFNRVIRIQTSVQDINKKG